VVVAPKVSRDAQFAHCARAFEEQFDFVRRALLRHGVRKRDAEDLAQDVFLVMWRRWADYDLARPMRPWLSGIATRVAADHLKKRSTREEPHEGLDLQDARPEADDQLAAERSRQLVLKALAEVPAKHRALLVLHDLDDVSVDEIAAQLEVPRQTIYARLRRARVLFARVVRRLQSLGKHAPLSPELLRELERSLERPALTRRR
jgi:RNA polymerase sigma-70 factor (ECF subfamily)